MALKPIQIHGWLQDVNDNFAALGGNGMAYGVYTATSDDATANEAEIVTGLDNPALFFVEIYRSNVDVKGNAVVTAEDGSLIVADGASYSVTAGDKIHWLAFDLPVEESE